MTTFVVGLTVLVIALATGFGAWRGARHMLRWFAVLGTATTVGTGTALVCYRMAWFEPLGLITPAVAGLLTLSLVGVAMAGRWRASPLPATKRDRVWGSVLGGCGGVVLAAELWLLATCAAGVAGVAEAGRSESGDVASTGSALQALLHTANHGFVRHLPLLGELGDEMEATLYILNAPTSTRASFARLQHRWLELEDLDSYRELVADPAVAADLDAFRGGDLLALYRLQKNARFLSFFREDKVQSLLPGLRPTTLAQELAAASATDRSPR